MALLGCVAYVMNELQYPQDPKTFDPVSEVVSTDAGLGTLPATNKTKHRNAELLEGVHASAEHWPTEAFSESATKWLKDIASRAPFESIDVIGELTESVAVAGPLRPRELKRIALSTAIVIHRSKPSSANSPAKSDAKPTPLAVALRDLYKNATTDARCELKIIHVSQTEDGFTTVVHAEGGGKQAEDWLQWTARWNCSWTKQGVLQRIEVEEYEEVQSNGSEQTWFVDLTAQTIGSTPAYRDQLLYGMDYWVNRLEHRLYPNRLGHHGLAIADFDGNGLEDLYVCQPGGLPNRLFLHQANGSALESAEQAGVDVLDDTTAALAADLDNDDDQDLVILTISGGYLLENDGSGKFTVRATLPSCRNAFSITAADYDNDGLLDLYVGRYWPDEKGRGAIPLPVPYYDATNGGTNILFRNTGDWKLSDVTKQVGLGADNTRYTMAAAWDPAAAMRHADGVLRVAPDEPKAHERLGLLYARSGKVGEAKHHFTSAIQHQTKPEPRTHYDFGKLLRSTRSTSEALEQFSKAIAADPKYDPAYEQLGLIRASQRQFEEAAKLFAAAAAIQPSTPSYRVNHAMALTQLKRDADAWETLRPIIAQPDVPPMALLLGARSLGNLKRFSDAIPLLERFLEQEPGAADVRKQLQFMQEQARTQ